MNGEGGSAEEDLQTNNSGNTQASKGSSRRLLGTLVLLLIAARSASNCVLPAKDADILASRATSYTTGGRVTSSSVLFGVQKGNVMQPPLLELALVLLRKSRKHR